MLAQYAGFLIAHGEKRADISKMSIRTMDALCSVYKERDKARMIELATATRMSQAESKDFKKWLADIEKNG